MANGVVVQLAVFLGLAAVICAFIVNRALKNHLTTNTDIRPVGGIVEESPAQTPVQAAVVRTQPEVTRELSRITTVEPIRTDETRNADENLLTSSVAPTVPAVRQAESLTVQNDRNERILANISANIQKRLIQPVPTYSPIEYPPTIRETEYVRVKKQIITPHGQVRFSILKDAISTNMLAVFRRASMDWETPDDLIGFVPPYLKPEAEVVNGQVLLIGTPGHNEKLAIPIGPVDRESPFSDCFDFTNDGRAGVNSPAVLLALETELRVVTKGVIASPNREVSRAQTKFLVENCAEALQAN